MKTQKNKKQSKEITKKAEQFYEKYNVSSQNNNVNDTFKSNGNFKYIWDFKSESNTNITTSIY